ncbi:hypothetical protein EGW08_002297 [Elysia chlorotica]|uniref:Carbonic anhydrase n=1 Tax=Elysia chlorotica TaxID=188477 RepID=A0A3S1A3U5_ELYCH|nr:hypothetical protein EGW08_002297 [Elysia chlorotica]
MNKLLRGIVTFNSKNRKNYLAGIQKVEEQIVKPMAVFITCMDCRLDPPQFLQAVPGEIFIIRNPGNMVPFFDPAGQHTLSAEGGGLELGCIMNGIGDVVVCGHSDCKAVNSLYTQRYDHAMLQEPNSPLKSWLSAHGLRTVHKFNELFSEEEQQRSVKGETILGGFKLNFGLDSFVCHVDPENKFPIEDKLSQFHTLQQASHIASYPILRPYIATGDIRVHAMWFDIPRGEMHLFNASRGHFAPVTESELEEWKDKEQS